MTFRIFRSHHVCWINHKWNWKLR